MSVLTLAAAKQYLNITTGESDAELQDTIDEAEAMVAQLCGPLTATTVTARVLGGGSELRLPVTPVISVTSVTPYAGSALDLSSVLVSRSGIVQYGYGGTFANGLHDVVYVAGRTVCPDDLLRGVKALTKNLWSDQRPNSASASPFGDTAANTLPGAAYLFTFKVMNAIGPHVQVGV